MSIEYFQEVIIIVSMSSIMSYFKKFKYNTVYLAFGQLGNEKHNIYKTKIKHLIISVIGRFIVILGIFKIASPTAISLSAFIENLR